MWKKLLAAGVVALWAGTANAVTMTATFAGTVIGGLDATGTFLVPGSEFSDQHFSLTFTYGEGYWTYPGLRLDGSVTGGPQGDYDYDLARSSSSSGFMSPIMSASLTINGKTYSLRGLDGVDWWGDRTTDGTIESRIYKGEDYASGPINYAAEDSFFSVQAGDRAYRCSESGAEVIPHRYNRGCAPWPGIDQYWRDDWISASFFNPLLFADLEAGFRTNQTDTRLNWGGSFSFSDCAYDGDVLQFCSRKTSGSFSVASLTVGTGTVPLPASAWFLLGAIGGLGSLSWRRRQRMVA
jgi:hypothetical protein